MSRPDEQGGYVHHAVIQFMPLEETGEFANIGAVVFTPLQRTIVYQLLAIEQADRILNFFAPMRPNVLQQALRQADAVLRDASHEMSTTGSAEHMRRYNLWQRVIASKSAGCRFANSGLTVTNDGQRTLSRLMQNMVLRHIPKAPRAAARNHSPMAHAMQLWPPRGGALDPLIVQAAQADENPLGLVQRPRP